MEFRPKKPMKAFSRKNAEKSHGFTLMEIVIAIAIIVILAAIAVTEHHKLALAFRYQNLQLNLAVGCK